MKLCPSSYKSNDITRGPCFVWLVKAPMIFSFRKSCRAFFFTDIDSQLEKTKLDQVYATALAADEGLLWVGTSVGVTLVFPLPRLEGIPLVSGTNCHPFYLDCNALKRTLSRYLAISLKS